MGVQYMKICKHCNKEYSDKLMVCPYCLKSEKDKVKGSKEKNKKIEKIRNNNVSNFLNNIKLLNSKGFFIYFFSFLSIALLFIPLVKFVYVPDDEIFDMKYFVTNKIQLTYDMNIIKLLFGFRTSHDHILPNMINLGLIACPILISIFKNKRFSFIFIVFDIIFLFMTKILFFGKGMVNLDSTQGFQYEVLYTVGFFVVFVYLILFLAYDIFYLFGSEKNGNDM